MKKKGFVFIETIITIVFLAAALLVLYSSYRNAITEEKSKVYYDDISYLYRNYYLADFLINKTEISKVKETAFQEKYVVKIEELENNLYSEYQKNAEYPAELETIKKEFNVSEMVIVSEEVISKCYNAEENSKCEKSYEGLNDGLTRYIETMNLEEDEDEKEGRNRYYLVSEYRERATEDGVEACKENEEKCQVFSR